MKQNREFSVLKIKDYKYWSLFLHENQCYLGRTYLLAKDVERADLMEIGNEEKEELFEIGREIKRVLNDLFLPDKMNYAALGNVFERLHVHFIPRYRTKRMFLREEFIDKRWGHNYAPYDHDFKISDDMLNELKIAIRNSLEDIA